MMNSKAEGTLLRIFIAENDQYQGKPLYEEIVLKAKSLGLAGATVIRGVMGFGADSHMHTAKVLRLSEDLPLIVEMVDARQNIEKILPYLDEALKEGLVTLENITMIKYRKDE